MDYAYQAGSQSITGEQQIGPTLEVKNVVNGNVVEVVANFEWHDNGSGDGIQFQIQPVTASQVTVLVGGNGEVYGTNTGQMVTGTALFRATITGSPVANISFTLNVTGKAGNLSSYGTVQTIYLEGKVVNTIEA